MSPDLVLKKVRQCSTVATSSRQINEGGVRKDKRTVSPL